MAAQKGKDLLVKIHDGAGYTTVAGLRSRRIAFNAETVLTQGGVGLAGEAGPEAILPLSRGRDGRLGVAAGGQGGSSITVNIATPDAESFRRSETYITGQIARAVARGQRSL